MKQELIKENLKKFKLKDLHMDNNLISIRKVNPVFVSRYRQNYRNGAIFPPLVIDKKTNTIVSGNHRFTAMMQEFGEEYEANCIVKSYPSEREILIDFAKENTKHGNPIDGFTKKLLINELLLKNVTVEDVCRIFDISAKRVEQLGEGMVTVTIGKTNSTPKLEVKPAKRGFEPPRPITQIEYSKHKNVDRGLGVGQLVQQLVRWLVGDLLKKDEKTINLIKELKDNCEKWLSKNG